MYLSGLYRLVSTRVEFEPRTIDSWSTVRYLICKNIRVKKFFLLVIGELIAYLQEVNRLCQIAGKLTIRQAI